jgi:MYXO-CTERM domain-containing protein
MPLEEHVAVARAAITVGEAIGAGCSTTQVAGLSQQIIAQGNCIEPGAFADMPMRPNLTLGGAVLAFLEEPARDALVAALDAHPTTAMQVNSMLRTVAQQYLLYEWYEAGTCGIGLAATPGNSNHETGLAVDVQENATWRPYLEAQGFDWLGASDPVHFDYVGPGAVDHRGLDVLAFQQLWNINHPEDLLDEDGEWGPQTASRLDQSPAEGFTLGADCGEEPDPAVIEMVGRFDNDLNVFGDGPSATVADLFEGDTAELEIVVTNAGGEPSDELTLHVENRSEHLELIDYAVGDDARELAGADFDVVIPPIEPAASLVITVTVLAASYSVDEVEPQAIGLTITGVSSDAVSADVYSHRRWTWDGRRLEGWHGLGPTGASTTDGRLTLTGNLEVESPPLDEALATVGAIHLRAEGDGATLELEGDAGSVTLPLDLAAGETVVDVTAVAIGETLVAMRVRGVTSLDAMSLEAEGFGGPGGPLGEDADAGCSCGVAGFPTRPAWLWAIGLLGLARLRRRR